MMPRIEDIWVFNAVREAGMKKLVPPMARVAVGWAPAGAGTGPKGVYQAFAEFVQSRGSAVKVVATWVVSAPASRSRWSMCAFPASRYLS